MCVWPGASRSSLGSRHLLSSVEEEAQARLPRPGIGRIVGAVRCLRSVVVFLFFFLVYRGWNGPPAVLDLLA